MSRYNLYATLVGGLALIIWLMNYTGDDSPRTGKIGGAILMLIGMCLFSHHFSDQISRRNPYADDLLKCLSCIGLTVLLVVMM